MIQNSTKSLEPDVSWLERKVKEPTIKTIEQAKFKIDDLKSNFADHFNLASQKVNKTVHKAKKVKNLVEDIIEIKEAIKEQKSRFKSMIQTINQFLVSTTDSINQQLA